MGGVNTRLRRRNATAKVTVDAFGARLVTGVGPQTGNVSATQPLGFTIRLDPSRGQEGVSDRESVWGRSRQGNGYGGKRLHHDESKGRWASVREDLLNAGFDWEILHEMRTDRMLGIWPGQAGPGGCAGG